MVKRINGVVTRVTTFNPDKPWMRHGTWNVEKSTRALIHERGPKVAPMGEHGLVVRKNGA